MLTLLLLRVGVGMHFFGEGATKLRSGEPFSRYFLAGARGPLAPLYHSMIWDGEGRHRLGYAEEDGQPTIDIEPTMEAWDQFRVQIGDHYELNEAQRDKAKDIVDDAEAQLNWYLMRSNYDKIVEYFKGLQRREALRADPARQEVPSLWGQAQTIEGELASQRREWLNTVDGLWNRVESELNALGREASAGDKPPLPLRRLGRRRLDSVTIDQVIPWFDLVVGSLLIAGLFTRLAAAAGGLFLASVVVSQWPGALGAQDTWYQIVEMLALFALAGTAAGRFAGLDSVLHKLRLWCCPPRASQKETSQ